MVPKDRVDYYPRGEFEGTKIKKKMIKMTVQMLLAYANHFIIS